MHRFSCCDLPTLARFLVLLLIAATFGAAKAQGQAFDRSFEAALAKPFRGSLGGSTLREMLDAVDEATAVPYWLDRRVDPQQVLGPVTAGPQVEQAYRKIAHAADLAALPLGGVVVIGRPDWVDRIGTAWSAFSEDPAGNLPEIAVDWPLLTTPDEAIQQVADASGLQTAAVDLPHDLWPSLHSPRCHPAALLLLIGAQFDRWIRPDAQGIVQTVPLPDQTRIVRQYPASARAKALRSRAAAIDPQLDWKVQQQRLFVRANPRAHRLISGTLRQTDRAVAARERGGSATAGTSAPKATFRFRLKNAPAGAALATLAKSAGWELEIDSRANAACQQLITLEDDDERTLEQWVQIVVDQAGLKSDLRDNHLRIDVE